MNQIFSSFYLPECDVFSSVTSRTYVQNTLQILLILVQLWGPAFWKTSAREQARRGCILFVFHICGQKRLSITKSNAILLPWIALGGNHLIFSPHGEIFSCLSSAINAVFLSLQFFSTSHLKSLKLSYFQECPPLPASKRCPAYPI